MNRYQTLVVLIPSVAIAFLIGTFTADRPTKIVSIANGDDQFQHSSIEKYVLASLGCFPLNMPEASFATIVGKGMIDRQTKAPDIVRNIFAARDEGYQEGDTFVSMPMGETRMWFQFRNGLMINRDPDISNHSDHFMGTKLTVP